MKRNSKSNPKQNKPLDHQTELLDIGKRLWYNDAGDILEYAEKDVMRIKHVGTPEFFVDTFVDHKSDGTVDKILVGYQIWGFMAMIKALMSNNPLRGKVFDGYEMYYDIERDLIHVKNIREKCRSRLDLRYNGGVGHLSFVARIDEDDKEHLKGGYIVEFYLHSVSRILREIMQRPRLMSHDEYTGYKNNTKLLNRIFRDHKGQDINEKIPENRKYLDR